MNGGMDERAYKWLINALSAKRWTLIEMSINIVMLKLVGLLYYGRRLSVSGNSTTTQSVRPSVNHGPLNAGTKIIYGSLISIKEKTKNSWRVCEGLFVFRCFLAIFTDGISYANLELFIYADLLV